MSKKRNQMSVNQALYILTDVVARYKVAGGDVVAMEVSKGEAAVDLTDGLLIHLPGVALDSDVVAEGFRALVECSGIPEVAHEE